VFLVVFKLTEFTEEKQTFWYNFLYCFIKEISPAESP